MAEQLVSNSPALPVGDRVRLPSQTRQRHCRHVSSIRPFTSAAERNLTVRHAHAHVVDLLPVLERLPDRTLTAILLGIMVVLQEMADEELVLGLCAEQETEADGVEQAPREGVHEVQRERVRGEDRECNRIEQDED